MSTNYSGAPTPDTERSYIMSPKLALISAPAGLSKGAPLDLQQRGINHHEMEDTPGRLVHMIQWQGNAVESRGLKNLHSDDDAPEEESSHMDFTRATREMSTRKTWHGPLS